jgi:hypothetical protein
VHEGSESRLPGPHDVLGPHDRPNVPAIAWIGKCKTSLGQPKRLFEQPFVKRKAADHAIERHYSCGMQIVCGVKKIRVKEPNAVGERTLLCLGFRFRQVSGRRVDCRRLRHSPLEKLKGERPDSAADIEQRSLDQPRSAQAVPKQSRCRAGSLPTVLVELIGGLLLVELLFGRVAVHLAARCHPGHSDRSVAP